MPKPVHVFKDERGKVVRIERHDVHTDEYLVEGDFPLMNTGYQIEQTLIKEILRLKKLALGKK